MKSIVSGFLLVAGLLGSSASVVADDKTVNVVHAGSLTTAFNTSLAPAFAKTGYRFEGEGKGSVALANLIKNGTLNPDVFVSSDASVMADLLKSGSGVITWYATFATSRIVVAYSRKSERSQKFDAAAAGKSPWYDVLASPGIKVARTDPAVDPKGYRTIMVMQLAESFYRKPGLRTKLLGDDRNDDQLQTDENILIRLEGGEVDAGFVYATEAIARHLPFIELPPQINLGDSAFAKQYASATLTVNGVTRTGEPIEYAYTIPHAAQNVEGARQFLRFIESSVGRSILSKTGLTLVEPAFFGDLSSVPKAL
jgi:molybdate/tungstate transport system substrate-binding protein